MSRRVVVLTGGVGGAKLVLGLTRVIPAESITAVVNTADDFEHLGLKISPDIDTLLYTLSGQANPTQGWGREGESWNFMAALRSVGGDDWFALGDGDLALHIWRTKCLAEGMSLSTVTKDFAVRWGIVTRILPMTDDPVATMVMSSEGELPFQHYFVKRRSEPKVTSLRFEGAAASKPAPGVIEAITAASTRAIIIAPSNPYLSIDPILAVPGIRGALAASQAPVIAVSPVIGGQAVKGPTSKIMQEFDLEVSPSSIAAHYAGLIDGLLVDEQDRSDSVGISHTYTDILMTSLDDRARVAHAALDLADRVARR